tara:strand:+ start:229 stop:357 length:129 start_codon:yes stop_codon:yes gene_type:complete
MEKVINLEKWRKIKQKLKLKEQKLKLIKMLVQFGRYFEIKKR